MVNPAGYSASGVKLLVFSQDDSFSIEMQRSPESTGSTGTASTSTSNHISRGVLSPGVIDFTDSLPVDGSAWFYRGRGVGLGYDPSAWSTWTGVKADYFDKDNDQQQYTAERSRRLDTLYDSDATLNGSVLQVTGSQGRSLSRGYQSGQTADGSTVTFPVGFNSVPTVFITGGLSYQPTSTAWKTSSGGASTAFLSSKPQYDMSQALDLTSTGFVCRAKLRQKGAQSTHGDDFSTGNNLTSTGATTALDLTAAPSADDSYTIHYSVQLGVTTPVGQTTIANLVVSNDSRPTSTTAWTPRGTTNYVCVAAGANNVKTWSHEQKQLTVGGLSTASDWRVRVVSLEVSGPGSSTLSVNGYTSTNSNSGATYTTATDIFASKTPDSDDSVTWEAWEV